MARKPHISIITVNLNNLEGLKRTLESVFEQTWKDFEFVIIDGGSSDGSREFIESQSEKVDYWVSEQDSGIYNAMNKGIKAANGEYLLFLNSGDHFFNNESLNINKEFISDFDLIYFDLNVVDGNKSFIKKYPIELSFNYLLMDSLPHPATFIKKSLFSTIVCYDESLKIVSDWKFFIISICKSNASYHKINDVLSTFYCDGISSNLAYKDEIIIERQQVLDKHFSMFLQDNIELKKLRGLINNFKKSKKINFLVRIGLLNKF